jgi:hypothetical protein
MKGGSTMLAIVKLFACLSIAAVSASPIAGNQDDLPSSSQLHLTHPPNAQRSIQNNINNAVEEVPMLKRVYPDRHNNRVQHIHHHHYYRNRPFFSESDGAWIRGPPGAERGYFGQVGAATALGTGYIAGAAVVAGACETAEIWIPALARCVARAANCVGEACNHVIEGASNVAASVRARQQALTNRQGSQQVPAVEAPPVQGAAPANPSFRVNTAPLDRQTVPYQGNSRTSLPARQGNLRSERDLQRVDELWRAHRERARLMRKEARRRAARSAMLSSSRAAADRRVNGGVKIEEGPSADIDMPEYDPRFAAYRRYHPSKRGGIGKGKGILKTPAFKKKQKVSMAEDRRVRNIGRQSTEGSFDLNQMPPHESSERRASSGNHDMDTEGIRPKPELQSTASFQSRPIKIEEPSHHTSTFGEHAHQVLSITSRLRRKGKAPMKA